MILNLFPKSLANLFLDLEELGFNFCLVGGAVRDFYLTGKLSRDLDFEVRCKDNKLSDLKDFLILKKIKFESLPYEIIRFTIFDYDLEISPPRTEVYIEGNTTHHNFISSIDFSLSYIDSFKRRDFTINAVGVELSFQNNKEVVIDPFNGISSIKEKTLSRISDDFYYDPVRFLRLIRYHILLSFEIDSKIKEELGKFNLESLSVFHLERELKKSQDTFFFGLFSRLVLQYDIPYPKELETIVRSQFTYTNKKIDSTLEFILTILIEDESLALEFAKYFNISNSILSKLVKTRSVFLYFKKMSLNEFKSNFSEDLKNYGQMEVAKYLRFYFDNRALVDKLFVIDSSINILKDIELTNTETSEYINLTEDEKKNFRYHKSIKFFLDKK